MAPTKTLRFTKMHGLGNDFVVINAFHKPVSLSENEIRYLGDRHRGVGYDQLLIVEPSEHPEADFKYRIFNPDGIEVEQCGNGARCIARYAFDQGIIQKNSCSIETMRGLIRAFIEENDQITIDMGIPSFEPSDLPLNLTPDSSGIYQLSLDHGLNCGSSVSFDAVSVGNPHAVIRTPSAKDAPVKHLGPWIETHPVFPKRTNVEFVEYVDEHTLKMRIFERGAGETQACGSGACAAAASFLRHNWVQNPVTIHMQGGSLQISWEGEGHPVWMTGPAVTVFHAECILP